MDVVSSTGKHSPDIRVYVHECQCGVDADVNIKCSNVNCSPILDFSLVSLFYMNITCGCVSFDHLNVLLNPFHSTEK